MIQLAVLSNHQSGRDTHLRNVRVHSPVSQEMVAIKELQNFQFVSRDMCMFNSFKWRLACTIQTNLGVLLVQFFLAGLIGTRLHALPGDTVMGFLDAVYPQRLTADENSHLRSCLTNEIKQIYLHSHWNVCEENLVFYWNFSQLFTVIYFCHNGYGEYYNLLGFIY